MITASQVHPAVQALKPSPIKPGRIVDHQAGVRTPQKVTFKKLFLNIPATEPIYKFGSVCLPLPSQRGTTGSAGHEPRRQVFPPLLLRITPSENPPHEQVVGCGHGCHPQHEACLPPGGSAPGKGAKAPLRTAKGQGSHSNQRLGRRTANLIASREARVAPVSQTLPRTPNGMRPRKELA